MKNLLSKGKKWISKFSPVKKLVMIFWAIINPIIWRLGWRYKWIRTSYKKIRKGKWLWGVVGAIKDYDPSETDEKYTPEDYESFKKYTEEIFKAAPTVDVKSYISECIAQNNKYQGLLEKYAEDLKETGHYKEKK